MSVLIADDAADLAQPVTFMRSSIDAPFRVAKRINDFLESLRTGLIAVRALPFEMIFMCLSPRA